MAPLTPTTSAEIPAGTIVERVQDFVAEHKNAILITTAAAAVAAGIVYVQYASAQSSKDGESSEKKKKKKKSSSKDKKKDDSNGPILEERKPKVVESTGLSLCQIGLSHIYNKYSGPDYGSLSAEEIFALPEEVRFLELGSKPSVTCFPYSGTHQSRSVIQGQRQHRVFGQEFCGSR